MTTSDKIAAIIDAETADMSYFERLKFLAVLEAILRDRMETEPEPA